MGHPQSWFQTGNGSSAILDLDRKWVIHCLGFEQEVGHPSSGSGQSIICDRNRKWMARHLGSEQEVGHLSTCIQTGRDCPPSWIQVQSGSPAISCPPSWSSAILDPNRKWVIYHCGSKSANHHLGKMVQIRSTI